MDILPSALEVLAEYRQFITYVLVPRPDGRTDKIPESPYTGLRCDAHDPSAWADFGTAQRAAKKSGHGVGFTFTDNDPFFFLDIDHCLVDGAWTPLAVELCQRLAGAAIEVSSSGTGLHIFGHGKLGGHSTKNSALGLELYHSRRFVALTGLNAVGDARTDHTEALRSIIEQYFAPNQGKLDLMEWRTTPIDEWDGPKDDNDLIRRAYKSESAAAIFGKKALFRDLWDGNTDKLIDTWPAPHSSLGYDASSADSALCSHLAFWTGRDHERTLRIMQGAAIKRDKWNREDYIRSSIINASMVGKVCIDTPRHLPERQVAPVRGIRGRRVEGNRFLNADDQIELFAGCVYMEKPNKVIIPDGTMLGRQAFRSKFGGYTYLLDDSNTRISRDAWEAFTESQIVDFDKVHDEAFRPDLAPGTIFQDRGKNYVNSWRKPDVPKSEGDASLFTDHIAKLLPNGRDQAILLSYLAAMVQYPGEKFTWAPVLIGPEGNGKSIFSDIMRYALSPEYVYTTSGPKIANKFNGWMYGRLLVCVEDIYVPEKRMEILEDLKPMIAGGSELEIERKGLDQVNARVFTNFLFNSNHRNAIRKHRNERRFAIFYTRQVTKEDIMADGMDDAYFQRLWSWIKNEDGYAIITHFLATWPIPDEFNPATRCKRAPETSSTEEAIRDGLPAWEAAILEKIEDGGEIGFKGGWVSSTWIRAAIERGPIKLSKKAMFEIMDRLGYAIHPLFKGDRVNSPILFDNSASFLWTHKMSDLRERYATPLEAVRAYEAAQIA